MNKNITVVYYTSNREKPEFEKKLRNYLYSKIKGMPLVSVSQKPIDFGENVCVNDVGASNLNVFRQMQIGTATAKTKFVCITESDYLHPNEYFEFVPKRDDIFYCAMPIYVLFANKGKQKCFGSKKRVCEGAIIVSRDFLLRSLETMLDKQPIWSKTEIELPYLFSIGKHEVFSTSIPLITFKTDEQLHRRVSYHLWSRTRELPHWGSVDNLIRRYL